MKNITAIIILMVLCVLTMSTSAAPQYYESVWAMANPTYCRSGPNTTYDIVARLKDGDDLEWTGERSYDSRGVVWYRAYYDGDSAVWISGLQSVLCDPYGAFDPNSIRSGINSNRCSVYANYSVEVRDGPGYDYESLGTLGKGDGVDFTGFKTEDDSGNTWYQIKYTPAYGSGWVPASHTIIR